MTSDGREIYFCRSVPPHYFYTLYVSRLEEGGWSHPEVLPFSGQWRDSDPVLSPDGQQLFFVSDRAIKGKDTRTFQAYVSPRTKSGGWGKPFLLSAAINQPGKWNIYFVSMARNGNLYFTRFPVAGNGDSDVFVSRFVHGKYAAPENLGGNVMFQALLPSRPSSHPMRAIYCSAVGDPRAATEAAKFGSATTKMENGARQSTLVLR